MSPCSTDLECICEVELRVVVVKHSPDVEPPGGGKRPLSTTTTLCPCRHTRHPHHPPPPVAPTGHYCQRASVTTYTVNYPAQLWEIPFAVCIVPIPDQSTRGTSSALLSTHSGQEHHSPSLLRVSLTPTEHHSALNTVTWSTGSTVSGYTTCPAKASGQRAKGRYSSPPHTSPLLLVPPHPPLAIPSHVSSLLPSPNPCLYKPLQNECIWWRFNYRRTRLYAATTKHSTSRGGTQISSKASALRMSCMTVRKGLDLLFETEKSTIQIRKKSMMFMSMMMARPAIYQFINKMSKHYNGFSSRL
ncbi:hypothetical protein E2C01_016856 [Portunus trituberculatus]|uniref:Uncharacterized protein n=1 Tax=Portunus trituberculatus TaxID=210409 RepID=A0A5B7DQ70_PORTR|nr:hypothetical protein [Portunus trituberculatus]